MLRKRANVIAAVRWLLVATLVSASIVVAARMKFGRVSPAVDYESASSVVPNRGRVQIVHFTLYDTGIYPREARANPGPVTISIEDLTGSSSGLIVERVEATARVPAGVVNRAINHLRSRVELLLPAGRYELSDATRQDNRALLIIEP